MIGVIGFSCVLNLGNFIIRVFIKAYSTLINKFRKWKIEKSRRTAKMRPIEQVTSITLDNNVSRIE